MAFGIKRQELIKWKEEVEKGNIAFLTHYWYSPRWPNCTTVTKVGCCDLDVLAKWGEQYGLKQEWIHKRDKYPHFDLMGKKQTDILLKENKLDHLTKFHLTPKD